MALLPWRKNKQRLDEMQDDVSTLVKAVNDVQERLKKHEEDLDKVDELSEETQQIQAEVEELADKIQEDSKGLPELSPAQAEVLEVLLMADGYLSNEEIGQRLQPVKEASKVRKLINKLKKTDLELLEEKDGRRKKYKLPSWVEKSYNEGQLVKNGVKE